MLCAYAVASNILFLSCLLFVFVTADLYFFIKAVIAKFFIPAVELAILTKIPIKEAKAEI